MHDGSNQCEFSAARPSRFMPNTGKHRRTLNQEKRKELEAQERGLKRLVAGLKRKDYLDEDGGDLHERSPFDELEVLFASRKTEKETPEIRRFREVLETIQSATPIIETFEADPRAESSANPDLPCLVDREPKSVQKIHKARDVIGRGTISPHT